MIYFLNVDWYLFQCNKLRLRNITSKYWGVEWSNVQRKSLLLQGLEVRIPVIPLFSRRPRETTNYKTRNVLCEDVKTVQL